MVIKTNGNVNSMEQQSTNKHSNNNNKSYFNHEKGFTSTFLKNLTVSEAKVKEYCNDISNKIDFVITSNNVDVQNEQKELRHLINHLKSIQEEIGIVGDNHKKGISSEKNYIREKQEALNQEGSIIRNEINQCKKELYFTSEHERESLSKAEEVRAAKRRAEENKTIDTNDLTTGVRNYKKLGLDFCKKGDFKMKISFSNFDIYDKNRTASFIFVYRDDNAYVEVEDCVPSLRVTTLRTLTTYLNADYQNNLTTFLLKMRKAFSTESQGYED